MYYNQQRFINYTEDALKALGEQLEATMALQNSQALNWLLAKEGGVCTLSGDQSVVLAFQTTLIPEGLGNNHGELVSLFGYSVRSMK